jgi:pantetheine-phosphate adenylyltransferase
MGPRIGLYPGTFDPITNGHLDIIQRAMRLVDHLVVAVAENAGKGPLFSSAERVKMVANELDSFKESQTCTVEVRSFDTLLVNFADLVGAGVIIRGLRAVSDFEYEFQMAGMNSRIATNIETVFLMSSERCQFTSSRFVKEIGRLNGDISSFVSARVMAELHQKFAAGL